MKKKSFGKILSIITRHQRIVQDSRFEKYGFSSGQYSFYIAIAEHEGINQREISEYLKINKATTNKALKKLEDLGYVETRIDENDKRLHCVFLTESGKNIYPNIRKELNEYTELISEGLDDETKKIVFEALELMAQNVKTLADQVREKKNYEDK